MQYGEVIRIVAKMLCVLGLWVGSGFLQAMGLLSNEPKLVQTELTPAEMKQLNIRSGWANDDPQLMLFEIGNGLSGPIFCVAASFDMKDGKQKVQAFDPKLYIPPKTVRRTSVRGVEKKEVKQFGFTCLCMKASPQGPCENAFK